MKREMIVAMLVAMLTGCASVNFDFPSDIKDECYGAKNESKAKIENRGTKLGKDHSCIVTKHPGDKRIGGMWCWYSEAWGQYVGGTCTGGSRIEVGCNPETMGEVMYAVEEHEFAHYWLVPTGDNGHDPLYRQDFYNWYEPRGKMLMASKDMVSTKKLLAEEISKVKAGEWVGMSGVDTNGVSYNIDFVKDGVPFKAPRANRRR